MPTTFANTIDGNQLYAARSVADKDGHQIDTTYSKSADLATVATTGSYNDLSNKPTIPTLPTINQSDDGKVLTAHAEGSAGSVVVISKTWEPPLFEAQYGISTFADIVKAIEQNKIVYCRVSPGATTSRFAFLAYIGTNSIEFQYYRSVSTHSATQQTDQVFVYEIKNNNTWTTTTREAGTKIAVGTGLTSSYSNGVLTISLA